MSKDPFQILADELTLIRGEITNLQRTSLDKDEAKKLHAIVAAAVDNMWQATTDAPQALQSELKHDRMQMARDASNAATQAAEVVLGSIREQLTQERHELARATGEARREAWRWFGGFWVWLTSMLATGAVIGVLATIWIQGRSDAREFGQYPGIFCGGAGGQVVEQDNGATYCAIWIKPPEQ